MDITISINCDNAAFKSESGDDFATADEVRRILQAYCDELRRCCCIADARMKLYDINGNHVGTVTVTP